MFIFSIKRHGSSAATAAGLLPIPIVLHATHHHTLRRRRRLQLVFQLTLSQASEHSIDEVNHAIASASRVEAKQSDVFCESRNNY